MVADVDVADLLASRGCVATAPSSGANILAAPAVTAYVQQNQPPGVPPLELTGERTLPDVPEENYWYRRHLAVYRWIARALRRQAGRRHGVRRGLRRRRARRRRAATVVGVDANPEAHEHARLRYRRRNLSFERALVEQFDEGAP